MSQGKEPSPSTPSSQRKILGGHVTRSLIFHVPDYGSCHGMSGGCRLAMRHICCAQERDNKDTLTCHDPCRLRVALLDAFAKLLKLTVSFVMSLRLSA